MNFDSAVMASFSGVPRNFKLDGRYNAPPAASASTARLSETFPGNQPVPSGPLWDTVYDREQGARTEGTDYWRPVHWHQATAAAGTVWLRDQQPCRNYGP